VEGDEGLEADVCLYMNIFTCVRGGGGGGWGGGWGGAPF